MAEQVTIPGTKKRVPKWAAAAGVGGTGILIIIYYRNKKASPAAGAVPAGTTAAGLATGAAAGSGSDPYPWDGTYNNPADPYSMDTSAGITYGDESAGIGGSGYGYSGGGGGGGGGAAGPPFSTNAAWSAWVIQQLEANDPNLSTTDVQNAIGEYISGQPVTAPFKTIIFDAIAVGGNPPVAGAAGYPPKVHSTGTGTGGTPAPKPKPKPAPKPAPRPAQVTVPEVTGLRVEAGQDALTAAGLVAHVSSGGPRNPRYTYEITSQTPAAGRKAARGSKVDLAIRRG